MTEPQPPPGPGRPGWAAHGPCHHPASGLLREVILQATDRAPKVDAKPLASARELWGKRYGRPVTEEGTQGIIDNAVGFAEALIDWFLAD